MTSKETLLEFLKEVNNFGEFEDKLSKIEDNKIKGDLFELFCQVYLITIHPEDFKSVKLFKDIDPSVLSKLNLRFGKDWGIDLIAITQSDEIWAVQAKFRSSNTLSWKDLSTFHGSSNKADFQLVMGNLDQILHPLEKIEKCSFILRERFYELDEEDFKKIRNYLGAKEKIIIFEPKEHQATAIQKALDWFEKQDKGQMIHACGTGKTLTALWIKEKLKPKNTIYFVPSLALLKQTLEEWFKHRKDKFSIKCVCSDPTVAKGQDESDEPILDLAELGVPVTTEKEEIVKFLKNKDENKVIFSTYQSTQVILDALKELNDFSFDFGVFDEAHRTATKSNKLFGLCLNVPIKKKMFMTATPKIYTLHLKKRAKEEDIELCSMDDEKTYGEVFDEIKFGEAIKLKLLANYKIKIIVVSDEDVKELIDRRYWLDVSGKEMTADDLAKLWTLIQSMKDVNHVISFHSRIKRAKEFSADLQNALELLKRKNIETTDIKSFHISGNFPAYKRSNILKKEFIKAKKSLVTNARCLIEGVDVPEIDGIYFVDPKNNLMDIVQATGRAIRKKKNPDLFSWDDVPGSDSERLLDYFVKDLKIGWVKNAEIKKTDNSKTINVTKDENSLEIELNDKEDKVILKISSGETHEYISKKENGKINIYKNPEKYGHIILPVFIGDEEDLEEVISGSAFEPVWSVIQAMKDQDERLQQVIENMQILEGKKKIGSLRSREIEEYKTLEKKLGNIFDTEDYILPKKFNLNEFLDKVNVRTLEVVGQSWDWWYGQLKAFLERYDNKYPLYTSKNNEEKKLATWCVYQRKSYREGTLQKYPERIKKLGEINFGWNPTTLLGWEENYRLLKEFLENNNRMPKISSENEEEKRLCSWCNSQKRFYGEGTLQEYPDRIKKLEEINFDFEIKRPKYNKLSWEENYELVKSFLEKYGKFPMCGSEDKEENRLVMWCKNQRVFHTKGSLEKYPERIKKLEKINFDWYPTDTFWWEMCQKYVEFKNEHKREPYSHVGDEQEKKLGKWCHNQRQYYKKGIFKEYPDRIKKLNEIGFKLESRTRTNNSWEEMYQKYIKFKEEYDHEPNWNENEEEQKLYEWYSNQRSNYNKGVLKKYPERIKKLEEINFNFTGKVTYIFRGWEEYYEQVKAFFKTYGRLPTSSKNEEEMVLYRWCYQQKTKRKGTLQKHPDRIEKLKEIGFEF